MGTPIGNPLDITLRALEAIKSANLLLVEDPGVASRLCKAWGIPFNRDAVRPFNEHSTEQDTEQIASEILAGRTAVMMSDAGMPVFCDPGRDLVALARKRGIRVEVLPGANALVTALVHAGISSPFYFAGFPPRKTEERAVFFRKLNQMGCPVAVYETPYRTRKLLGEIASHFGSKKVIVCVDLTGPHEFVAFTEARNAASLQIPDGPPVVIVNGAD